MSTPPSSPTDPALAQALSKLTGLGLRMAEAITQVTEAEQRTVAVATSWLPAQGATASSTEEATSIGMGIDAAEEALAHAVPRVTALAHAFERIARAVRRTVALARRLEQGWPASRPMSDTRRAMLIRQAVRGVSEVIRARTQGDGEAAERLFADLAASLDDPAFEAAVAELPVEDLIEALCRKLGLTPEHIGISRPDGTGHSSGRRHEPG